jgi:dihydroorotate dehydrogenase electron transfer subunit
VTGRTSVTGRSNGPVRAICEVLRRQRSGAYWSLTVSSPEIAERAKPGQFIEVAVDARDTLLRRPFSIARVSPHGPRAGTVEFVFDAHGPGTEWLSHVEPHTALDIVGPLGSAFPLPARNVNCLLIGGGYGVAPLFFLGDELTRLGMRVDMIVGAASADRIHDAIGAKRMSASVTFTTEDGSLGTTGRVTDVMDDVITATSTNVVYACGPNPMLAAVSRIAAAKDLPCQVAVEEHMACGVGVCWTCVMPIKGKDGAVRMKRSCIDGPVFSGHRIDWDATRWVPVDPVARPAEAPGGDQ